MCSYRAYVRFLKKVDDDALQVNEIYPTMPKAYRLMRFNDACLFRYYRHIAAYQMTKVHWQLRAATILKNGLACHHLSPVDYDDCMLDWVRSVP